MSRPHPAAFFLTGIFTTSVLNQKYRGYIEELRLAGSERVLEVGSGAGSASIHLAKRLRQGGHLTMLEPSPILMERARQKLRNYPNVSFVHGEIHDAGFEPASFDAAVSHSLFHALPHPDRSRVLRTMTGVLTGKGKLYVREPLRNCFEERDIRRLLFEHDMEEHAFRVSGNTYDGIFVRRRYSW